MTELEIPVNRAPHTPPIWWAKFFYSCKDWREVGHVLAKDWNARIDASPIAGEVGTIIFQNEQDLTLFLLRWS